MNIRSKAIKTTLLALAFVFSACNIANQRIANNTAIVSGYVAGHQGNVLIFDVETVVENRGLEIPAQISIILKYTNPEDLTPGALYSVIIIPAGDMFTTTSI